MAERLKNNNPMSYRKYSISYHPPAKQLISSGGHAKVKS